MSLRFFTPFRSQNSPRLAHQHGFTLIEVLASAFIFAIGLLGLASLHVSGQRYNHEAYLRSQATIQAYDMADRMRVNRRGIEEGAYDAITPPAATPDTSCFASSCSAAQLAAIDAAEWQSSNAAVLPVGQGTVSSNGDGTFTITIRWDEDSSGAINAADPSFSTRVRP